jgi:ribonuclease BN (tRNA processing enzyme)
MSDTITFLGTADGRANARRNHASLLARIAGKTILLDTGQPCSQTLKRLGVGFNELDGILITHTHTDHVGGLAMLIQAMWLDGRRRTLPIWLPRQGIRPFAAGSMPVTCSHRVSASSFAGWRSHNQSVSVVFASGRFATLTWPPLAQSSANVTQGSQTTPSRCSSKTGLKSCLDKLVSLLFIAFSVY